MELWHLNSWADLDTGFTKELVPHKATKRILAQALNSVAYEIQNDFENMFCVWQWMAQPDDDPNDPEPWQNP